MNNWVLVDYSLSNDFCKKLMEVICYDAFLVEKKIEFFIEIIEKKEILLSFFKEVYYFNWHFKKEEGTCIFN